MKREEFFQSNKADTDHITGSEEILGHSNVEMKES